MASMIAHESRWYQREAVDSLFDFFAHNQGVDEIGKPVPLNPLVAMPTGTGKSHVISDFTREAMGTYPGTRVIMATHVKELIEQNAKKLQEGWPMAPLGVYSAGIGVKDYMQPIIFGGVQSMVRQPLLFGRRDLLVVDEAHLIATDADTNYLKFIKALQWGPYDPAEIKTREQMQFVLSQATYFNPFLRVIGLTATPYRLGLGLMTNGQIFTHLAYNLCTIDAFNRLIAEGYLCTLIPKKTATELDVSGVGMSNGEFQQGALQAAVDKHETTYAALQEVVALGYNRACWMLFATGVEHAEHITEMLNSAFGIPTVCVHSKRTKSENDAALAAWKSGQARAIVNMNKLTTGVDHKPVDLIAMLRPTMSPGLWVQMLGRGTRPYNYMTEQDRALAAIFPFVKENCLVLDFAGNTRRLGPINDPVIPRPKGQGKPGDAPVRICPQEKGGCGTYNHASARFCIVCGHEFLTQENVAREADTAELLRSDLPQIEVFNVLSVVMTPHQTKELPGKPSRASIKVSYFCSGAVTRTFYEYISVESSSRFFRHKSRDWFRQRYHYSQGIPFGEGWDGDAPNSNSVVLSLDRELRQPKQIRVWVNKQTPEIMSYEF